MICNVIDKRRRPYRWKAITAIVEPTFHDNSCSDSDQALETAGAIHYEERPEISLADAVKGAQAFPYPFTLYLYDLGQGINVAKLQ